MNNAITVIFVKEGHIKEINTDALVDADVVIEVGKEVASLYKHRFLAKERLRTADISIIFRSCFPKDWGKE